MQLYDLSDSEKFDCLQKVLNTLIDKRIVNERMIVEDSETFRIYLEKLIYNYIDYFQIGYLKNLDEQISTIWQEIYQLEGWKLHYRATDSACWAEIKSDLKYHIDGEYKEYKKQSYLYLGEDGNLYYPYTVESDFHIRQRQQAKEFGEKYHIMILQYYNLNKKRIHYLMHEVRLKENSKLTQVELQCLLYMTENFEDPNMKQKYQEELNQKTKYKVSC